MNENSEYNLQKEEVGLAWERGIITDQEREMLYARYDAELPEVQYFVYEDKWPVRGMYYEGEAWVAAKDLISPFGSYHGASSIEFIPEQHRQYITGVSSHGKETFLCLDSKGVTCLFDMLIHLGY
jgi:hypothetical protein